MFIIDDGLLLNFDASSGYSTHKFVECFHKFFNRKTLVKVYLQAWNVERKNIIIVAVRRMYHKLELLDYSQISQEQTGSPFDMSISKSKYDATFLSSDVTYQLSSHALNAYFR